MAYVAVRAGRHQLMSLFEGHGHPPISAQMTPGAYGNAEAHKADNQSYSAFEGINCCRRGVLEEPSGAWHTYDGDNSNEHQDSKADFPAPRYPADVPLHSLGRDPPVTREQQPAGRDDNTEQHIE